MSNAVSGLSLRMGGLLLVATGFVDAYLYLAHGRVFAEAQTGNLVLVAVGAFEPHIVAFWRPLLAYAAFVAGVALAWRLTRNGARRAQVATLSVQTVMLAVVAFLPTGFPNPIIVAAVAGGAGLQIASFAQIGAVKFTTVVMTSNTLHVVSTALRAWSGHDGDQRQAARQLIYALSAFVVGVFAGAGLTRWLGTHAVVIAAAGYLAVLIGWLRGQHTKVRA